MSKLGWHIRLRFAMLVLQLIPTLTPEGATAFDGGRLRSAEMFDVLMQCFANGATGLSLFEDPYVDDPGVYLA